MQRKVIEIAPTFTIQPTRTTGGALSCAIKQRGSAMTEALLYMGVVALLVAAAYGAYKVVNGDVSVDKEIKGTVGLISKVRQVYGPAGDYTNATAANIIKAGIVPPDFTSDSVAGKVFDAYRNTITFTGSTSSLVMSFPGLSADSCTAFGSGLQGLVTGVTATNGTAGTPQTVKSATSAYNPTNLAAGCASVNNDNIIALTIN